MRAGSQPPGLRAQLRSLCFVVQREPFQRVRLEPACGVLCDSVVPALVKEKLRGVGKVNTMLGTAENVNRIRK